MPGQLGVMPSYGSVPIRGQRPSYRYKPAPPPSYHAPGVIAPTYHGPFGPPHPSHPTPPVRFGSFRGPLPQQPFHAPAPQRQAPPQRAAPPSFGRGLRGALNAGGTPIAAIRGLRGGLAAGAPSLRGVAGATMMPGQEREIVQGILRRNPRAGPAELQILAENALGRVNQRELNRIAQPRVQQGTGLLGAVLPGPIASVIRTGAMDVGTALANLHPLPTGGPLGILGRGVNELVDLPGQSFLTGALAGSSAASLLKGKPAEAKALGGRMLEQIEHPVRSAEEAPLATGLMLLGGAGAASRFASGLARGALRAAGAEGTVAGRAFSTARPDLFLYDTPNGRLSVPQTWSKGSLFEKPLQIALEKGQRKAGRITGPKEAPQAEGRLLRRHLAGGITHPGKVDTMHAAYRQMEQRAVTQSTTHAIGAEGRQSRLGSHVGAGQRHVFTGLATSPEDYAAQLTRKLGDLKDAERGLYPVTGPKVRLAKPEPLHGEALELNKLAQHHIEDAIAHPPQPEHFAAMRDLVRAQHANEAERFRLGALQPEEAVRRSLQEYMQHNMGARYFTVADHQAAEAAALKAGNVDLAREVSGRGLPENIAAHGQAISEAAAARRKVSAAQTQVRAAASPDELQTATEHLRRVEANAKPALEHGSVMPKINPGWRTAEGKLLTNRAVFAHMEASGIPFENGRPLVGYLSHSPPPRESTVLRGSRSRPSLGSARGANTGEAFHKGLHDYSYAGVVRQVAANSAKLTRHISENRKAIRLGLIQAGSLEEAKAFIRSPEGSAARARLGDLAPHYIGPEDVMQAGAFGELPPGAKWTVLPRSVSQRFSEQATTRSATTGGRAAEMAMRLWRQARLFTSTRHIFGVPMEQLYRMLTEGVAPGMHVAGRDIGGRAYRLGGKYQRSVASLAEEDGPLGDAFKEMNGLIGGRGYLYEAVDALDQAKKGNAFQRTSSLQYIRRGYRAGESGKAVNALTAPWRLWKASIQAGMGRFEHQAHQALVGKAVAPFFGGVREGLKMQDEMVGEVLRGHLHPDRVEAFALHMNNMYGNWSAFTPDVRRAVNKYAPFAPWWLNSMRWLARLPLDHPLLTGIAASLYYGTKQLRAKEGQGINAPPGAPKHAPEFLQGTVPVSLPIVGKVRINPAYYSSVKAPEWQTAADMIAPGLMSVFRAAQGQNELTGQDVKTKQGQELSQGQIGLNVLSSALEMPTPGLPQAQSLLQRGGKPYGTANLFTDIAEKLGGPPQVKPETQRTLPEELMKLLFPERFIQAKAAGGGSLREELAAERRQIRQELHGGHGALQQELRDERRKIREELKGR